MSTPIEIYDALLRVGLAERVAQDIANSVGGQQEAATKHDLERFQESTKHDLTLFRESTKHDLALFQEDVRGQFRELTGLHKADTEGLRREMAEVKADLTARLVVMTGIFIAAVSALRILT